MIVVLRLGHRPQRDQRVTTHVALAARALGADEVWVSTKDEGLERTVASVVDRFGGKFRILTGVDWRKAIRGWKGTVVHLTMYGERLSEALPSLKAKRLMVVVGAEKVPREVYGLADRNVSVGNQPHSEVAALAIFLDRYTGGKALDKDFRGRLRIVPDPRGKTVVERGKGKAGRAAKQG
ncbi:MAG: tRNA (cytidine(56)-2'-O)-methyltransferase [Euryarchaeota archaeon RBG_16_62_10]|nr:MAG: tRNA (cytidine(56)-2'-O)-methyltransferase [Euryarchaeota archaeon RBG_16_62_10]